MRRKKMLKEIINIIKRCVYYIGLTIIISLTYLIIFIGLKGEQQNKDDEFVKQLTPEQFYR